MDQTELTPESLKEKAVDLNGAWFHVHKAFNLDGEEWSLVGYWMPDNKTPVIPFITQLMIPYTLIKLADVKSVDESSSPA